VNIDATTVILPARSDPLRSACAGLLARCSGKTLDSYRIHLDLWLRWCTQVGLGPGSSSAYPGRTDELTSP